MAEKQPKMPAANSAKSKHDHGNPKTKPQTGRPNPSPLIDLASIWAVQLARRAREQVWGSARTQLKIVMIAACHGAKENARRAFRGPL